MKHGQRWIGQTRLDTTHIRAKQIATISQFLLGDFLLCTQLLDTQAKGSFGIDGFVCHPPTLIFVYSLIHTLIHTFECVYQLKRRGSR